MKIIKQLVLLFIFLIFNSHSSELISYSGRLTQVSGAPISGPVSLTVDVLVGAGPTLKCSHTNGSVALSNGVFHLEFDYATTCDTNTKTLKTIISEAVTAGDALYIRVTDNTNTKTYPVQSITGSPLAVYALGADSVKDGSITNLSISGIGANCAAGEVMKADGTGGFTCAADATGGAGTVTSVSAGTGISVTGTGAAPIINVNLTAAEIPNLDAAKITTGIFADARIPNLNASKINAGTFVDARIPNLDASKTTSGTFATARIPNLDAGKITTGTLVDARIPNLDTSKITTGTFVDARIPNLDAAKVTTGTFATARIPSITSAMITDGTIVNADIGLDTITLNKLDAGVCGLGTVLSIDVAGDVVCTADTGATNWTTSGADIYRPAGNVGIGAAPAVGNKLDVNGKVEIGSNANTDVLVIDGEREFTYSLSGAGATTSLDVTPSSDALTQRFLSPDGLKSALTISTHDTAASNYVHLVPNGGKVGIGNAAPATALDVTGTITATELDINTTGGGGAITHANAEVGFQLNSSNLKLESVAGPRFYINRFINEALSLQLGGGDVAIGRATPGSKLDVNGTIRAPIICDETGANCKDVSTGWGAAGTITSITAGTGLTGGTITTSGTVAVDVGTTAGKIPQLDGSGDLPTSVETDPTVTAFAKAALPTCGVGEVLKGNGTNLTCVTDATIADTNTNAQTICTGATFLDGNGACTAMTVDTTIPDTNTNAQTICTGATFLDGDGNCTAMSSGADNLGNHTATTHLLMSGNRVVTDTDADTYISSGGDDQIDFVVGGSNSLRLWSGALDTNTTGTFALKTNGVGTAAAPAYSFAGNSNTGLFRPIANTIAVSTNGAERLRVDATGNVGIGTTTPAEKLFVQGPIGSKSPTIAYDTTGVNDDRSGLMFGSNHLTNNSMFWMSPDKTNGNKIHISSGKEFNDATTNGVTLTNSGNFGVGENTPIARLHVSSPTAGKMAIIEDTGATSVTNANPFLEFKGFNTDMGYVGFGSTGTDDIYLLNRLPSGKINFGTNDTTARMVIDESGYVGIGTDNPSSKLHVRSATDTTTDMILESQKTGLGGWASSIRFRAPASQGPADEKHFAFSHRNGGTTAKPNQLVISSRTDALAEKANLMTIEQTGNIGIGTGSPSSKLQVVGTVTATAFSGDGSALTGITSTGSSTAVDNTIAADSDANASGKIVFQTAGTTKAVIDNSGKMGIGTASPTSLMHVVGGASPAITVESDGSAGASGAIMKLTGHNGATSEPNQIVGLGTAGGGFKFDTATTSDAMRIIANGNVGIGTTAPTAKIHVVGDALGVSLNDQSIIEQHQASDGNITKLQTKLRRHTAGANWFSSHLRFQKRVDSTDQAFIDFGIDGISADNGLGFGSVGTTNMVLNGAGNVGIGTKTPTAKLHLNGSDNREITFSPGTTSQTINFQHNDNGNTHARYANITGVLINGATGFNSGHLTFSTAPGTAGNPATEERMRVDSSGKVGIGTTSPDKKFHVSSDGANEVYMVLERTTGSAGSKDWLMGVDIQHDLIFGRADDSGTLTNEFMTVKSGGSVGIGTNAPSRQLHISGAGATTAAKVTTTDGFQASLDLDNSEGAFRIITDDGTLIFQDDGDGAERMRIDTSGNVGIGTATPGYKLDVQGGNSRTLSSSALYTAHFIGNTGTGKSLTYYDAINGDFAGGDYGYVGQIDTGQMEYKVEALSPNPYHVFSGGNVGIGISTPSNKLSVHNSYSGDPTMGLKVGGTGTYGFMEIVSASASDDGDVPYMSMHRGGDTAWQMGLVGNNFTIASGGGAAISNMFPAKHLTIATSGNVGLGITTPTQKLDVSGNVRATAYFHSSDERLKENIKTSKGLEVLRKLRGVEYNWIDSGNDDLGVIAQEVLEVIPTLVNDKGEFLSVNYDGLFGPTIESIKELDRNQEMFKFMQSGIELKVKTNSRKIASLEKENQELKDELASLKAEVEEIKKFLKGK